MNITILDIIDYIKKHMLIIILSALICALFGYMYVNKTQSYVASTSFEFISENAKKGLDENGKALDVYEIMSPTIIEQAIKDIDSSISVESVRNGMTVTPMTDTITETKQESLAKSGEDYDYFPTQYKVTLRHSGRYGSQFGIQLLNKIVERYNEYIMKTQTNQKAIANIFTNLNYDDYDYMEISELYDNQLSEILDVTSGLKESDPNYRSSRTGLSFNDLHVYFSNLMSIEYAKYYSYVRKGLLSKNEEIYLKNLEYKIQNLKIDQEKNQDDSNRSYQTMMDFYSEYKKGQQINRDFTGGDGVNENSDVWSRWEDWEDVTTTYDKVITRYVDSGTYAAKNHHDIYYYTNLLNDFSNDHVPDDVKAEYTLKANELMERIHTQLNEYISLANDTIQDYNNYKGTKYVSFMSSVSTKAQVSRNLVMAFATVLGICIGLCIAIGIELFKKIKEQAQIEIRRRKMELLESGKLPIDFEELPPLDKAFFEAIYNDFEEFRLYYLPIVNSEGDWIGAEALARWDSKEFGMVMPSDFITIAEKYDIMELLGKWIIKEACTKCKLWNKELSENLFVSVNFLLSQISGEIFMDNIIDTVTTTKINPANLMIELSKGGEISDFELAERKLQAIKSIGVKIAIDNFGSAKSNVEALYRLPVDLVKIDRGCTITLDNMASQNMVRNVANVAQMSDIKICAEGVETTAQEEELKSMGINYFEGYLYSKPITAEQFAIDYKNLRH